MRTVSKRAPNGQSFGSVLLWNSGAKQTEPYVHTSMLLERQVSMYVKRNKTELSLCSVSVRASYRIS